MHVHSQGLYLSPFDNDLGQQIKKVSNFVFISGCRGDREMLEYSHFKSRESQSVKTETYSGEGRGTHTHKTLCSQ